MEHAPLRPVPNRPAGPIDPAAAAREVAAVLPGLTALEARALAFVGLAERPRSQVALMLGVPEAELAGALAAARKELRRTSAVLGGSGWCERAERLISDRLDGALAAGTDATRLDVHLKNCPRCVEHERRLVQATDALLARAAPPPEAAPPVEEPPAEEPPAEGPTAEEPTVEGPPAEQPPAEEPAAEGPPPAVPLPIGAGLEGESRDEASKEDPAEQAARPEQAAPLEEAARPEEAAPPAPLAWPAAVAPTEDQIAAAAEVLVAVRTRRQLAAAITWNALALLAVLLTLATIALTVAGILGAEL